jgi:hypothetical protein
MEPTISASARGISAEIATQAMRAHGVTSSDDIQEGLQASHIGQGHYSASRLHDWLSGRDLVSVPPHWAR